MEGQYDHTADNSQVQDQNAATNQRLFETSYCDEAPATPTTPQAEAPTLPQFEGLTPPEDQENDEGAASEIILKESDFERIGPKAAEFLKLSGVTEIGIKTEGDITTVSASLKEPIEIPTQDAEESGTRKLTIANEISAELTKNEEGGYVLDRIAGVTAEVMLFGKYRTASLKRLELTRDEDGNPIIEATGSKGVGSRTTTRDVPEETLEKANILFSRLQDLKVTDAKPSANAPSAQQLKDGSFALNAEGEITAPDGKDARVWVSQGKIQKMKDANGGLWVQNGKDWTSGRLIQQGELSLKLDSNGELKIVTSKFDQSAPVEQPFKDWAKSPTKR